MSHSTTSTTPPTEEQISHAIPPYFKSGGKGANSPYANTIYRFTKALLEKESKASLVWWEPKPPYLLVQKQGCQMLTSVTDDDMRKLMDDAAGRRKSGIKFSRDNGTGCQRFDIKPKRAKKQRKQASKPEESTRRTRRDSTSSGTSDRTVTA